MLNPESAALHVSRVFQLYIFGRSTKEILIVRMRVGVRTEKSKSRVARRRVGAKAAISALCLDEEYVSRQAPFTNRRTLPISTRITSRWRNVDINATCDAYENA